MLKEKLGILHINDIVIGEKLVFLNASESPTKRGSDINYLTSKKLRLMRMPSNNSVNSQEKDEDPNPMNGGVFISPLKIKPSFLHRDRGR